MAPRCLPELLSSLRQSRPVLGCIALGTLVSTLVLSCPSSLAAELRGRVVSVGDGDTIRV